MTPLPLLPLLALAAQPAPPAPYPAREVLAAFATACSGAENSAVNLASASAAGWERLPADADTPVSRLARAGAAAVASEAEDGEEAPQLLEGAEYRQVVAGRTLYLTVSGVRTGKIAVRGCRLFDFAATAPLSANDLHDWSVREPTATQDLPEGVRKITYNPGLKPGHMAMEIYFVPPGAQPVPGFELGGLTLVASALEL